MSNTYIILNTDGEPINRIVADQEFVDEHYPNQYRLEQESEDEPPIETN